MPGVRTQRTGVRTVPRAGAAPPRLGPVRSPITPEDAEELELSGAGHRQLADRLVAWAEEPHPDDALSPRELLTRAGEQLELADDVDAALELYRRAAAADGTAVPDPRAHLVTLLLQRGEREEALRWDRDLRRSRPEGGATYEYMGQTWLEVGDERRALGWYTRGILRHEQGPPFEDYDLGALCLARWRLRERLGHQPDDYDFIGLGLRRRLDEREQQHRRS